MPLPGFTAEISCRPFRGRYAGAPRPRATERVTAATSYWAYGGETWCCDPCGSNADGSTMWCCDPCASGPGMSTDVPVFLGSS
jgi:hypothetical protein